MKYFFGLFLCCFFIPLVYGGEIEEVFEQAYKLLNTDPDAGVQKIKKLEEKITDLSNKEQVLFHHKAAAFYGRVGNFDSENFHWQQEIELTSPDSDSLHKPIYYFGQSYLKVGNSSAAEEQFERSIAYAIAQNDTFVVAANYDALASVKSQQGNREAAIGYYLKSIRVLEKLEKHNGLAQAYLNMGIAYFELDELTKAYEARKKGAHYAQLSEDQYVIQKANLALAGSFNSLDQPDSARFYLSSALPYFESVGNLRFLNGTYNELGITYMLLEQADSAVFYYEKSITLLRESGYLFGLPGTLVNYGEVLNHIGEYQLALEACQEALPIVRTLNYPSLEAEICGCLYENYKATNQADSALYYFETHLTLEDSINNVEIQKSILTEELSSTFSQEKQGIIADANAEIEGERDLRTVWVVGAILLFIALIILYLAYRQKQKSNAIIRDEKYYLDNLLHNLVHEFRTPLTLIKGPTEELLKKDSTNKLLKLVDKNSDQMLNLVNQVLDFAKIKAGRLAVKNEVTDLRTFFKDAVARFQPIAKEKSIDLSLSVDSINTLVRVDSDKLFKIISNVLSNALKYSNPGATVRLTAQLNKNQLVFTVSDTGIGIDPKDQAKIFEKFYQVDATITRKGEGTGLGLAFVKELIQLMNGTIALESKLGMGTTVLMALPIEIKAGQSTETDVTIEKSDPQLEKSELPKEMSSTEGYKVLVVEDNKDLQGFLTHLLVDEGYEVTIAADGEQGVQAATETLPDLVISDVMMPKMDGYQLVQHLKSNYITEHIPIIMLTAKASFDSMLDGLGAGADDYISKPFKSQELILRIKNQILRQQKLHDKFKNAHKNQVEAVRKHDLVEKMEALMKVKLDYQFTAEELAEKCALSRSQLHRKIKFITGLSTTAFQTKTRLNWAMTDLKMTDLTVSEIAYKYGYNDPAHFTKLFKKEFDTTPSNARK